MTTIALSITTIVDNLLARTALRHLLDSARPPLLTRDQTPALSRLIRQRFASIVASIEGCHIKLPATDDDILAFESRVVEPLRLMALVEQAVTDSVLACAYQGIDAGYSATLEQQSERSVGLAAELLTSSEPLHTVSPYRY